MSSKCTCLSTVAFSGSSLGWFFAILNNRPYEKPGKAEYFSAFSQNHHTTAIPFSFTSISMFTREHGLCGFMRS